MGLVESWGGNPFGWFLAHLIEAPVNLVLALAQPGSWLNWSDPESLIRFIYYGASWELFFVLLVLFLVVTVCGMVWRPFMWGCVRVLEAFGNGVGRFFAWAGLLMVLQQILIIFMQRVFATSEIAIGLGAYFTKDVSWWSEELKLYNAMVVCLCVAYTFIQGAHVRVDLVYAPISYRAKKIVDMFGSLVFMIPAAVLTYFYGWFFLWRHLVTPKLSASDAGKTLDSLLPKARALRWNVETIGFSPNGFNAYFLFKILLVAFTVMVVIQAVAFFYRSYLELVEGPESEGRYLDRDSQETGISEMAATDH